jgi:hypothetical protein
MRRVPMSAMDWRALPAIAHRHGLAAVLPAALAERSDAPIEVHEELAAIIRGNAVRALDGMAQLLTVVAALERSRVQTVALKGPVLSRWLYGDSGFRRFGDLDVVVDPTDRATALRVLTALGYQLRFGMSERTAAAVYGALGAWSLVGGGPQPLDVHWRLAHVRFPTPLKPRQVLARCDELDVGGRSIRIPCATHAALLMLLHAAKHLWGTLEMVFGIAHLMRRDDVEWDTVRALARRAHGWRGCAAGLRLASELFAAEVPSILRDEPWPAATDALCEEAILAMQLPAGIFQDRWHERRVHRAAFDRWDDRIRYDLWRVVAPSVREWQWCPLPDALTPLYVPMRFVRLGAAAMSHPWRRMLRYARPARMVDRGS